MMRDTKSIEDAIQAARDLLVRVKNLNDSPEFEANLEMNAVVAELLLDIREVLRGQNNVAKWGPKV